MKAEAFVQAYPGRHRLPALQRRGCWHREASIEAHQILWQDGIGLFERAGSCQAEFTDQPILKGAPEPLNTPLRLWGTCGDGGDVELLKEPSQLRRSVGALQLL